MKPLHTIASMIICAASLAGCSKDTPLEASDLYTQIVTLTDWQSGIATFTYCERDDSPTITLTAAATVDTTRIPMGTRILISYTLPPTTPFGQSGTIAPRSMRAIHTSAIKQGALADIQASMSKISLVSMWRSGTYLNFSMHTPGYRGLGYTLVVDDATLTDDIPQAYLIENHIADTTAYTTTLYASVDIAALWLRPGVQGIEVHVSNTYNPYNTLYTFTK